MATLRLELLADAVELRHPAHGEVAVVQQHPATVLLPVVNQSLRLRPLSLSEGDAVEFLFFVLSMIDIRLAFSF